MKVKGEDLIFLYQIKRDGSGTEDVSTRDMSFCNNEEFELNSLSITYSTFVASGFNSYIVRKRKLQ